MNASRRAASRRHYVKHREEILEKRKAYRESGKANENARNKRKLLQGYITELKEATPCFDCEENYSYYVMDFDHVRGEKVSNIAFLISQGVSLDMLKDEIEKCDIVCSNCHRTRTHTRLSGP